MFTSQLYWVPFVMGLVMLSMGLIFYIIRPEQEGGGHEANFKEGSFKSSHSSIIILLVGAFLLLISFTGLKSDQETEISSNETGLQSDAKIEGNIESTTEALGISSANTIQQTANPQAEQKPENIEVSLPPASLVPDHDSMPLPEVLSNADTNSTQTAPTARLYFCKYINDGQESDCRDNYTCIMQTRFYMIIESSASIGTEKVRYRLFEIVKGAYHLVEDQLMEVNSNSTKSALPMVFYRAGSFYVEVLNENETLLAAAPVFIN